MLFAPFFVGPINYAGKNRIYTIGMIFSYLSVLLFDSSYASTLSELARDTEKQININLFNVDKFVVQPALGSYSIKENALYQWVGGDNWNPAYFQSRDFYANQGFEMSFDFMIIRGKDGAFNLRYCGPGKTNYIWLFDKPGAIKQGLWYHILIKNEATKHSIIITEQQNNKMVWEIKDVPHGGPKYGW